MIGLTSSGGSEEGRGGGCAPLSSVGSGTCWVCLGGGFIAGFGGRAGFGIFSIETSGVEL